MGYIADSFPQAGLGGDGSPQQRAEAARWLSFVNSDVHPAFTPLFNPSMPEEAKKFFRERLTGRFAHLNNHLANNDYLMGKEFSVADAYLFTVSNWASRVDIDLSAFPNVLAYRKRVGARPAVQAALKAEGLK